MSLVITVGANKSDFIVEFEFYLIYINKLIIIKEKKTRQYIILIILKKNTKSFFLKYYIKHFFFMMSQDHHIKCDVTMNFSHSINTCA